MQDLSSSPFVRRLILVLAAFTLLLGSFATGVHVGERKARHVSRWQENYPRMVPSRGFPFNKRTSSPRSPLPGGHGTFGSVLTLNGNTLVIQSKDGIEEQVLVTSSTALRVDQRTVRLEDLPTDLTRLEAAVFGAPTAQGQIQARLIRFFVRP